MNFDLNTLQIELRDWKAMVSAIISSVTVSRRLFDFYLRAMLSQAGVPSCAHASRCSSDHVAAPFLPNPRHIFSGEISVLSHSLPFQAAAPLFESCYLFPGHIIDLLSFQWKLLQSTLTLSSDEYG